MVLTCIENEVTGDSTGLVWNETTWTRSKPLLWWHTVVQGRRANGYINCFPYDSGCWKVHGYTQTLRHKKWQRCVGLAGGLGSRSRSTWQDKQESDNALVLCESSGTWCLLRRSTLLEISRGEREQNTTSSMWARATKRYQSCCRTELEQIWGFLLSSTTFACIQLCNHGSSAFKITQQLPSQRSFAKMRHHPHTQMGHCLFCFDLPSGLYIYVYIYIIHILVRLYDSGCVRS